MEQDLYGRIVLFHLQGELSLGIVESSQQGRYRVTDASDKRYTLTSQRFSIISNTVFPNPGPEVLFSFRKKIEQAMDNLDGSGALNTLADLMISFDLETACAVLGLLNDAGRFALFIHLKDNPQAFAFKKGLFTPRGQEQREDYERRQQEELQRQEYLGRIGFWLELPDQDNKLPLLKEADAALLAGELSSLLLEGQPRDLAKLVSRANPDADFLTVVNALRLRLGEIDPADDPFAAASGIPIRFAPGLWTLTLPPETADSPIPAFTIDDEDTRDYDDAFSLEKSATGYRLGIHISDVASRLPQGGELFLETQRRVSSLYLPGQTIPMLPPELSSDVFSLRKDEPRPVVSLYLDLTPELKIDSWDFRSGQVEVSDNFSYRQADARINAWPFNLLSQFCGELNRQRGGEAPNGRDRYYWQIKVAGDGIAMKRQDLNSPARLIVEELMVLYNRSLAERANSQPMIFRNVAQFLEDEDEPLSPVLGMQAYLSTVPVFHPGIGSQAYLHATSPVRRFTDIVNQLQFRRIMRKQPLPFSRERLEEMIPPIEKRLRLLKEVGMRSERHWFLKYLQQKQLGLPLDAIFLKRVNGGWLAELLPWERRIILLCDGPQPLQTPVKVVINCIDTDKYCARGDVIQ
jgi:exoribonuclease-2